MKCKVRALILMLLMCWASQSSAQTTRAAQLTQNSVEIIQKATPFKKLPRFDYLVKECLVAHGSTTKSAFEQKNWDESNSRLAGESSYRYDRMNYVEDYLFPYDPVLMHQLSQNKHFNEEDKEAINATVKILQLPKHGKLIVNEAVRSQLGAGNFGYIADLNFEGDDQVIFSANFHGKNYKIVMNLRVRYESFSEGPEGDAFEDKLCPNKYNFKRIKLSDASSNINID